jgi:Helix-turn-helix domain
MNRTTWLQDRRMQKFRDVLSRWESGALSMMEAGELLGMSERQFRRYRDRYEEAGLDGLRDRRLGKPSARRVPAGELQRMLELDPVELGVAPAADQRREVGRLRQHAQRRRGARLAWRAVAHGAAAGEVPGSRHDAALVERARRMAEKRIGPHGRVLSESQEPCRDPPVAGARRGGRARAVTSANSGASTCLGTRQFHRRYEGPIVPASIHCASSCR